MDNRETSEITLRLQTYDDIFSDFDMRPYSQRAISVDFLDEIKRAARDMQDGHIELILHAPERERSESREIIIKERLASHFRRHHHLLLEEKHKIMRFNIGMVIIGIFFMIAATLIVYNDATQSLLTSFLVIFLEPAAWFLLWEGMDHILFTSKSIDPELSFYQKMTDLHGHLSFKSY